MNEPRTAPSTFVAALQVSLDGYVAGPEGELDWVDSWADSLALVGQVDAFVLGRSSGRRRDRLGDIRKGAVPPRGGLCASRSRDAARRPLQDHDQGRLAER